MIDAYDAFLHIDIFPAERYDFGNTTARPQKEREYRQPVRKLRRILDIRHKGFLLRNSQRMTFRTLIVMSFLAVAQSTHSRIFANIIIIYRQREKLIKYVLNDLDSVERQPSCIVKLIVKTPHIGLFHISDLQLTEAVLNILLIHINIIAAGR